MYRSFRQSRLARPRATVWAIALVTGVFVAFGLFADPSAQLAEPVTAPAMLQSIAQLDVPRP